MSRTFGRGRQASLALDGVSMEVAVGELVCLLGSSGCGKSTLLNIIAGLDEATAGEVRVDGELVVGPGADRGVVFQGYSLFPWRTVAENIAFGLEVGGVGRERAPGPRHRAARDHEPHRARRQAARELSGGMRQRVAIGRALAPEPDVLLLDEPFAALDAQTRRSMQDFLLTLWKRTGCTIVMVTHDVEEAIYLAGRIYVMSPRPGRIAEQVTVPFGERALHVLRDPRFLDLRDELAEMVGRSDQSGSADAAADVDQLVEQLLGRGIERDHVSGGLLVADGDADRDEERLLALGQRVGGAVPRLLDEDRDSGRLLVGGQHRNGVRWGERGDPQQHAPADVRDDEGCVGFVRARPRACRGRRACRPRSSPASTRRRS